MVMYNLEQILENIKKKVGDKSERFASYKPIFGNRKNWTNHNFLVRRHMLKSEDFEKFLKKYFMRVGLRIRIKKDGIMFNHTAPERLIRDKIKNISQIFNCQKCKKPDLKVDFKIMTSQCSSCGDVKSLEII